MTQEQAILQYLKEGHSLTPIEALNKFGSFRLAAIILNLRQAGFDIKTEMIKNQNKKHFAKYSLVQPKQQIQMSFA